MAIKVNRVLIKNFKLFQEFYIDFDKPNLVVFDGPNGFGKTSFFDAVELLFTGRMRRYDSLADQIVDKREKFTFPWLNDGNDEGDLIIKAEIQAENQKIYLLRKCERRVLNALHKISEFNAPLYRLPDFDSDKHELVINEENYLSDLLGKDYVRNFEFLNYIEQEESIYLLKQKDKDRKEAIGHLFNTFEFETFIEKLEETKKKIMVLCDKRAKDELDAKKLKLLNIRRQLTDEPESVPYVRLISWKKTSWDMEELEFPEEQYAHWLGKDGELARLELFLRNIDEFKKDRQNKKLNNLLSDEGLVTLLLRCWSFIDKVEQYEKQLAVRNAVEGLLQVYDKGILSAIINREAAISDIIKDIVKNVADLNDYDDAIASIETVQKSANTLSKLLTGMRDSRDTFVSKFIEYQGTAGSKDSCPLCGYTWKDAEELNEQLNAQAIQLDELAKEADATLALALERFKDKFIEPIQNELRQYLTAHPLDKEFISELIKAKQRSVELMKLYGEIKESGIELAPLLNKKPSIADPSAIEALRKIITEKIQTVDANRLQPYFANIFVSTFDEKFEYVAGLDMEALSSKRQYIQWKYSLHQNKTFIEKKAEHHKLKEQCDNAEKLKNKLDNLKKHYEESLKTYQRSVIEDIEIIFHIYSGRIMQDYQCGLGLFLAESDGIKFLENPSKASDAVFSMSSGQLSALVISFTLALNKKYSKTKLLLIDDPVQTLDELNIAGLVELLRNEFDDRQIFISTHEDMMSAYMRYKFEKYGLKTYRLNFKEIMLPVV